MESESGAAVDGARLGFVDTLGFVALFGLFTAHVTGNLVLAGAELVVGRDDVFGKLLAVPVFVAAVAATAVWIRRSKNPEALLPILMVVEALWLVAAMGAGLLLAPLHGADAPATLITGMLMVIAMGMRNAATKLIIAFIAPTTVMTGNVVQLTIDFTALPDPAARARIGKFLPTVLGFVLGASLGAGGYARFGFAALVLPIAIILYLAIREFQTLSRTT
ncbi:DUF1275 domain-containing protein [bacterium]|nr:MAG: DUF1275 domain-containing protein [bacterium]